MIWVLLLALLLAAAWVAPFVVERRRPAMDDDARVNAPGNFAELSQGVTHFQWHGGVRGPVAVCVHGLTTPGFVWNDIAAELATMGYRVLTYDLYGRGYSDRPEGRQDEAFFVRQMEDLLAHQKVADDITLFGYSMGGVITTAFAAKHPDRIRQLVLVAPAGFGGFPTGFFRMMRDWGRVGDWMALALFPRRHPAPRRRLGPAPPVSGTGRGRLGPGGAGEMAGLHPRRALLPPSRAARPERGGAPQTVPR